MKLDSVIYFSENPSKLVSFYSKVLQKEPDWQGGEFSGFALEQGMLIVGPHDEVSGKSDNPERVMINLAVDDAKKEFSRIKEAGATVVAEPYSPTEDDSATVATLADPDNNYFQLVSGGGWMS